MQEKQASFDPGLTQQYTGRLKRSINRDGQFNVRRRGTNWRDVHPYLFLVNASWRLFIGLVCAAFIIVNSLFAAIYVAIGVDHLKGADGTTPVLHFLDAFFFSAHTLTTVGYGNIYPVGPLTNALSAFEALVGLMAFAIATGILYGRFSRASARFAFSETALIAPYQAITSLQFRLANRRANNILELTARVLLMTVEPVDGKLQRKFAELQLEREQIVFFALTWTVVHPITETSPLYGKTAEDLTRLQAELLIMMKGFDDTFNQTVHVRYSYLHDEIIWGARFAPAFRIDEGGGDLELEINKISHNQEAFLPARVD